MPTDSGFSQDDVSKDDWVSFQQAKRSFMVAIHIIDIIAKLLAYKLVIIICITPEIFHVER
jgi:hypothetical protein